MEMRQIRRVVQELSPDERERYRQLREEIERELPELIQRGQEVLAEKRRAALEEPTVSGQLRRAIVDSGWERREPAERLGIDAGEFARFLVGAGSLNSDTVDQLAALLYQELKPTA